LRGIAQPSSDETVHQSKLRGDGVFEVFEPAAEPRVEVLDDPPQTVASASFRQGARLVLERLPALVAHESSSTPEPTAEEIESLAWLSRVADPRLVRMRRQPVGRRPRRDLARRRLRFLRRPTQDPRLREEAASAERAPPYDTGPRFREGDIRDCLGARALSRGSRRIVGKLP
jgi:hypothetical protein